MRFDERVVRLAAATLPRRVRDIRREEWLADLEHADELGIPRRDVAFGAVTSALTARPHSAMSARRRLAIGAAVVGGALVATPVVAVAAYAFDNARGIVTVEQDADGTEQTVFWREYPGIAGLDADELLDGPTLEEGIATGEAMVAEMRDALTAEFGLEWAPPPIDELTVIRTENHFGGFSMLYVVNAPTSQTTTVPRAWADKERAIAIIGEVAARYGFGEPTLDPYGSEESTEDRIRDLGGATPAEQVVVSGMVPGPAGQWLWFSFQDLANDTTGRFTEQADQSAEHGWERESISLGYGANGLLPEEDRAEFIERLAPFAGYAQPEPQVS
ncbi:hypothetical protein [Pseudolysinimonas sp.]|jgi:hypothetical protein|uniref:hypothetical protein n=1 Tax=Pseudolysinimonas sp. TaxID=2680009 RepID=UPI003784617D